MTGDAELPSWSNGNEAFYSEAAAPSGSGAAHRIAFRTLCSLSQLAHYLPPQWDCWEKARPRNGLHVTSAIALCPNK